MRVLIFEFPENELVAEYYFVKSVREALCPTHIALLFEDDSSMMIPVGGRQVSFIEESE